MIDNSVKLAHDLTKLTISNSHRLIILDIKDLYVNNAILENTDIARAQLLKHNDKNTTEQICKLLKWCYSKTTSHSKNKPTNPPFPISGITAEIFLQHLEQSHVRYLLDSKHITFYARYVDGILKILDASPTNPDAIAQYSNSIHRNLQLNATLEANDRIHFLDLSIIRKGSQLEIDIFRKPTTTDTTISYLSNHPGEHKLAAYRYYIERMFNLPLNNDRLHNEWQTILHIAKNNKFPTTTPQTKTQNTTHNNVRYTSTNTENNAKWATFTSPHIRKITNVFKHTNVKIVFRCNNTIARFTKPPNLHKIPPHNKWGIYQLTCNSWAEPASA